MQGFCANRWDKNGLPDHAQKSKAMATTKKNVLVHSYLKGTGTPEDAALHRFIRSWASLLHSPEMKRKIPPQ